MVQLYMNNEHFLAGITLQENGEESNNMAFYTSQNPQAVLQNRQQLANAIGYSLQDFVCPQQTHSANFQKITVQHKGNGAESQSSAIPQTDALYTYERGIVLSIFTADCVPIILTNAVTGLCAVIHSGWQGTVKEMTAKLLQQLIAEGNNPADLHVQIGMALSQQRFEVDTDVYEQFQALGYVDDLMYFHEATQKYHIDNQLTVQKQILLAGVPLENIQIDRTCTYDAAHGFSYRQQRDCGRHMIFVVRK
ncbi:peptidoglycan editing factor PgeF [Metasolibacillus meyeri]|uniref:peptidoglycan editing factor PgeF n=1 Tax=Metasolibacillus meyeri TaxID=1071052 RepID=UPI000D32459F|nr:peptidoglycan editing factor PgeF [Metasolibacillus meyeri]